MLLDFCIFQSLYCIYWARVDTWGHTCARIVSSSMTIIYYYLLLRIIYQIIVHELYVLQTFNFLFIKKGIF